jgi:hypothetical protein
VLLPLGLIGLGAWLLLRRGDDDGEPTPPGPPPTTWGWDAATSAATAPVDGAGEDGGDATAVGSVPVTDPTASFASGDPLGDDDAPPPPYGTDDVLPPPPLPAVPPTPPEPRRRSIVGPIVFGCLLVWAGVAFLAGAALDTGLAGALLIIGIGFVFGAFVGGSRVLILPALLVAAALAVTAVVDIPLSGPIGQQHWIPITTAELDHPYEVSLGEGTLDLRALTIPVGQRARAEASVGVGHLVVVVPDGVTVEVVGDVGAGESDVFGLLQNGAGVKIDQRDVGDGTGGTLALDLQVGVGQLEVRRANATDPDLRTAITTSTTALG